MTIIFENLDIEALNEAVKDEELKKQKDLDSQKNGRKLKSNERAELTKSIIKALSEQEFEHVLSILNEYPSLTFEKNYELKTYVKNNFDLNVTQKLMERNLEITLRDVIQIVNNYDDVTLCDFVINFGKKNNQNNQELLNFYLHTYHQYNLKLSESRRHVLKNKQLYIEQNYPDLVEKAKNSSSFFNILFSIFDKNNSSEYFNIFNTLITDHPNLCKERIKLLFSHLQTSQGQITAQYVKKTFEMIHYHPNFLQIWKEEEKNLKETHQNYINFIDKYINNDVPYNKTLYSKLMYKYGDVSFYAFNQMVEEPLKDKNVLNLNNQEQWLREKSFKSYFSIRFASHYSKEELPFQNIPKFAFDSIIKYIIANDSPAYKIFLKGNNKKELGNLLINDLVLLTAWIKNSSLESIYSVLKEIPELVEWRDSHKNSIFHYIADIRKETTKTFIQMVARLNHDAFLEENEIGITIKNLLEKNRISEETKSFMEEQMIHRNLKDAGLLPRQTKKTKEVQQNRRRI